MSITVRFAREGDENKIAELLVAIHRQHAEGRPDLFGGGNAKLSAGEVKALFHRPDTPFFVAVSEDGEVVGYLLSMVTQSPTPVHRPYTSLYIDDLNVDASARRLGVGSALLDACRKHAKAIGCYNLTLNVWAFNTSAIAFYEKNGFFTQRSYLESPLD